MQSESRKNLIEEINAEQSVVSFLYLNFLKKLMNKNFIGILFSYLVLFLVAISIKTTVAYYSDIEQSLANIFSAGVIDLEVSNTDEIVNSDTVKINSDTTWEFGDPIAKFFDFSNLKPSDSGFDTIKLRVKSNPAWVCAKITNIKSEDGTSTEPESIDDATPDSTGELDSDTEFVFWNDSNNNNLPDPTEKIAWHGKLINDLAISLSDSRSSLFSDNVEPLQPNTVYQLKKAWCIGSFENGYTKCNGTNLNNRTQGDNFSADISFFAVQARHNLDFVCENNVPEPKYFYVCDSCSYTCSKVGPYNSSDECESSLGKVCHANQETCNGVCQLSTNDCGTPFSCNVSSLTKDGYQFIPLDKIKNCDGTYTYKFKIINNNNRGLSHASFSLPCGVTPVWPTNGSTYTGTSGKKYSVENPTNNPFLSIKFNTIDEDGIKNGAEEIFEFKLDKRIDAFEIQVESKAALIRSTVSFNCKGVSCTSCPKKYYSCETTNYTCGQTATYNSKSECESATGKACYDDLAGCQDLCVAKAKYYTCDSTCETCGQTSEEYSSITDCQQKTGKTCYSTQGTCDSSCKKAIVTNIYDTLSGQTGLVEAIARWGNNDWQNTPSEFLLKTGTTIRDSKEHSPWRAYNFYNFVIQRLADGTINFNVTSTDATNKLLTFKPVSAMGNKLIVEIIAPISGFSSAEILSYQKDTCAQKPVGQSIMINNCADPCICNVKYKRMEITGLDFSSPFKIYGRFKWSWILGTSDLGDNTPSMSVKFK
jgi:hypothetical protein